MKGGRGLGFDDDVHRMKPTTVVDMAEGLVSAHKHPAGPLPKERSMRHGLAAQAISQCCAGGSMGRWHER